MGGYRFSKGSEEYNQKKVIVVVSYSYRARRAPDLIYTGFSVGLLAYGAVTKPHFAGPIINHA